MLDTLEAVGGLLSYRQAAKLLGVDRGTTLKQLIAAGHLSVVQHGKRKRIPAGDVLRLAGLLSQPWRLHV